MVILTGHFRGIILEKNETQYTNKKTGEVVEQDQYFVYQKGNKVLLEVSTKRGQYPWNVEDMFDAKLKIIFGVSDGREWMSAQVIDDDTE